MAAAAAGGVSGAAAMANEKAGTEIDTGERGRGRVCCRDEGGAGGDRGERLQQEGTVQQIQWRTKRQALHLIQVGRQG